MASADDQPNDPLADVPEWDDEYLDRVSDRLLHNYDLEKDTRVHGESFDLYGQLRMTSHKQFLTPSISFGHQDAREHLFARRVDSVSVADLERLVELGHTVADDWIDANEEHYSTDFIFGLVVPEIPDDVAGFVESFRDRTLLKYGYYGHYQIQLLVTAPDQEELVVSPDAEIAPAFRLWDAPTPKEEARGLLARLKRLLRR